ncbi:MAG: SDR family oxidoreductase [Pseudomonadota bacterium]|nr:SDR family oxidoreductase [Pseudomonadota bacterium]
MNPQDRALPPQHQDRQPGLEAEMRPQPKSDRYLACRKLDGGAAIITGGDSGIGRAVAITFAKESADVTIVYLNEHEDAKATRQRVKQEGRPCITIADDVADEAFCQQAVQETVDTLGHLDILVNNAAEQHPQDKLTDINAEQLERTFKTNVFSFFYMAKAALPYLHAGAAIINSSSANAHVGNATLMDYSATKGAIVSFTRSLAQHVVDQGIRVNAVAPGPIWTPLIPATFGGEDVAHFVEYTPMKRAGQPDEIAPCYVFLASEDASYISRQVLHPNGGTVVNG